MQEEKASEIESESESDDYDPYDVYDPYGEAASVEKDVQAELDPYEYDLLTHEEDEKVTWSCRE